MCHKSHKTQLYDSTCKLLRAKLLPSWVARPTTLTTTAVHEVNTLVSTAIENDLFIKNSVLKQTHDFGCPFHAFFLSAYTIFFTNYMHIIKLVQTLEVRLMFVLTSE